MNIILGNVITLFLCTSPQQMIIEYQLLYAHMHGYSVFEEKKYFYTK